MSIKQYRDYFDFDSPFVIGSSIMLVLYSVKRGDTGFALVGVTLLNFSKNVRKYFKPLNAFGCFLTINNFAYLNRIKNYRYNNSHDFVDYSGLFVGIFLSGICA